MYWADANNYIVLQGLFVFLQLLCGKGIKICTVATLPYLTNNGAALSLVVLLGELAKKPVRRKFMATSLCLLTYDDRRARSSYVTAVSNLFVYCLLLRTKSLAFAEVRVFFMWTRLPVTRIPNL